MERLIRADKSPNLHPIAQQIGSRVWLQAERRASDHCDVVCFERVELGLFFVHLSLPLLTFLGFRLSFLCADCFI